MLVAVLVRMDDDVLESMMERHCGLSGMRQIARASTLCHRNQSRCVPGLTCPRHGNCRLCHRTPPWASSLLTFRCFLDTCRCRLVRLRLVRSAGESEKQEQSLIRRRWSSVTVHEVEGRSVTALWLSCAKISAKSDIEGAFP